MTKSKLGDPVSSHPLAEQAAEAAPLYDEQARAAGANMPGMRAPLPPGSLRQLPVDPQGDEHRDPPPGAPQAPPDPAGSQRTVRPGRPRRTDPAARGD